MATRSISHPCALVRALSLGLAALTIAFLVGATPAWANTTQDLFGLGSRAKAMGGVGAAAALDHSATYYNPASLAYCRTNSAAVEISHLGHDLAVDGAPESLTPTDLNDRTALAIGACVYLPARLSFGLVFEAGMQNPQVLYHRSLHSTPVYAMYGQPIEQITFMGAVSYRISDELAVGVGGSMLVSSTLDLTNSVPVVTPTKEIENELSWNLNPAAAPYAGLHYRPLRELRFGAAYRGVIYHKLEAIAYTSVELASVVLAVDLKLEAVSWYTPRQFALGAAYDIGDVATVSGDVTWYNWSAYPGPYITASPVDADPSIADALDFLPEEKLEWSDIYVPRIGGEFYALPQLALRAGLAHRPSPAPLPTRDQRANLMDSAVTTLSLGAGLSWGAYPEGAPATDPLGGHTPKPHLREGPQRANGGVIDFHVRVHRMSDQTVEKESADGEQYEYTFGGWLFDAGVTVSVGWF